MAKLDERYLPMIVDAECADGSIVPGTRPRRVHGCSFDTRCGLVSYDATPDAFAQWSATHCDDTEQKTCAERFVAMYFARISERYSQADVRWIENHCLAYPDACSSLTLIEGEYLRAHDAAVREAWKSGSVLATAEIEREQAERRRAAMRAIGEGLQRAADSMQQAFRPAVRCMLPTTPADGVASEFGDVHRPRGRRSSSG